MEYKQVGDSGLVLPVLTFGCWSIGHPGDPERRDVVAALRKAYELGCTAIDTAPTYGFGVSEEVVAEAIAVVPRDKVQILTKCGIVWDDTRGKLTNVCNHLGRRYEVHEYAGKGSIIRECENSLRRLKTDYIDLYSLHWPDHTTPVEESMEAFIRLKEQGKIRAAGVCNHSLEEMKSANKEIDIVSNKVRYSMLNRKIEEDIIPYCQENNKAVIAYSILQRGILTGRDLPVFLWPEDNYWEVALYEPENRQRVRNFLDKIEPIALDKGATLTHLCIRWAIDRPGITLALLGGTSAAQVVDDARAMDISLSGEETDLINNHLAELENELTLEPNASL